VLPILLLESWGLNFLNIVSLSLSFYFSWEDATLTDTLCSLCVSHWDPPTHRKSIAWNHLLTLALVRIQKGMCLWMKKLKWKTRSPLLPPHPDERKERHAFWLTNHAQSFNGPHSHDSLTFSLSLLSLSLLSLCEWLIDEKTSRLHTGPVLLHSSA
jgi:hypothetical protein